MAALNFPDPAVTPTYTAAGITWTWNAGMGLWSSQGSDPADPTVLTDADGNIIVQASADGITVTGTVNSNSNITAYD